MNYLRWVVVMMVVLMPTGMNAQDSDQELWLDQEFAFNIDKKTTLRLQAGQRIDNNVTDLFQTFFQVGVGYQALPWLSIAPNYRHAWNNPTNANASYENRYTAEVTARTTINRWRPSLRARFEGRYLENQDGFLRMRLRPGVQYALNPSSRFAPALLVDNELFYDTREDRFNRNRIRVGFPFRGSKHLTITLYYLIESTRQQRLWDDDKVLWFTMSWDY